MTTITDVNSDAAKLARRERRKELRECRQILSDALYKENRDRYHIKGSSGQLDEGVVFVFESPLGWQVFIELRADGTMPMRIDSENPNRGPGLIPIDDPRHTKKEWEIRDGDAHWLEQWLP